MCLGVPSEGTGFGFIPDLGLSRVRPGSWNPGFQDCRCRASRSVRTQRLQSGQMQLCLRELLYPSLKHTYTCNYMHWYIHACMCSSIHPSIHSFVHSFFCSCIYLCIHAFMQAGMPYRRTYTQKHASTSTSVSAHLDARVVCYKSGVDKPSSKAHMAERMSGEMASDCVCMGHSNKSLGTGRRSCQRDNGT